MPAGPAPGLTPAEALLPRSTETSRTIPVARTWSSDRRPMIVHPDSAMRQAVACRIESSRPLGPSLLDDSPIGPGEPKPETVSDAT